MGPLCEWIPVSEAADQIGYTRAGLYSRLRRDESAPEVYPVNGTVCVMRRAEFNAWLVAASRGEIRRVSLAKPRRAI